MGKKRRRYIFPARCRLQAGDVLDATESVRMIVASRSPYLRASVASHLSQEHWTHCERRYTRAWASSPSVGSSSRLSLLYSITRRLSAPSQPSHRRESVSANAFLDLQTIAWLTGNLVESLESLRTMNFSAPFSIGFCYAPPVPTGGPHDKNRVHPSSRHQRCRRAVPAREGDALAIAQLLGAD
jgi:hypothetical protein